MMIPAWIKNASAIATQDRLTDKRSIAYPPTSGPLANTGFSLIEVLISVVILSIGLLGIAGLQIQSYRYNHESYLRSVAVTQAISMTDMMRANSTGVSTGAYQNINFSQTLTNPGCSNCTPAQSALQNVYDWNIELQQALPSGRGIINYDAATKLYTIQVMWDDHKTGATGTGCSNNFNVDLSCVRLNVRL